MNRAIVLVMLLLLGAVGYLTYDNIGYQDDVSETVTQMEVSSTAPYKLDEIISEIRNGKYHDGYDNDTLRWMESLSQKNVFLSNDTYVIMDDADAGRIHHNTEFVTDVQIVEKIECFVVENRSLGGNRPYDILLVRNVTDLGNRTYYYEV